MVAAITANTSRSIGRINPGKSTRGTNRRGKNNHAKHSPDRTRPRAALSRRVSVPPRSSNRMTPTAATCQPSCSARFRSRPVNFARLSLFHGRDLHFYAVTGSIFTPDSPLSNIVGIGTGARP
jgi:hypothetical protein